MDRVSEAFQQIPRAYFLPPEQRDWAAQDRALPIAEGQSNSQPRTVEAMLRLLQVRSGDRVLDVGSGSGWTTALLGWLVGPKGSVLGLELRHRLVEFGRGNLAGLHRPGVRIEVARPDVLGAPDCAPFDRILVSASAQTLPNALVDQLGDDGIMVCPVGNTMIRVRRSPTGVELSQHGAYRFVPLLHDERGSQR